MPIAAESPDQPEVSRLLDEADRRSASLYPGESRHGLDVAALLHQGVRFFVARLDGVAVGCGGYLAGPDGTAEVKRMFVTEAARGHGFGRAILRTVADEAHRDGVVLLRLETGVKSVEALGLYRRFGFRERPPFGDYRPDPLSVFMEKPL